ncbi:TolC family protein [Defluviicoccus vanus]|uniref:TolC family protein n=1 Tax=Defluviicoccus vanus TaxID=111831 RepID=A0A7H1N6W2_9PROT|nr:TolC family protein [Defluviicoccus vanus]QNT71448.1 TolC family protein [Defluviicoccus vanus]
MQWLWLCILALSVFGGPARLAHAEDIRHVLESAWARNAEIAALTARRAEILARKRAAGRLTPGPPALGVGHLNDYVTGDDGYREYDVELGTPLWLPGEGTAIRRVADAELVQLDAELAVARLAVAGAVRDAYWRFRLAAGAVEVARRRLNAARALQSDLDRQVRAGQMARADLLLSVAETADARSILSTEEASATQARLAFHALTGAEPPVDFIEPEVPAQTDANHPRRIALRRTVDVTEAAARLLKVQDRDSPEVALLGVVERQLYNEPYDKRIGVRVVIPFATEGRNEPRRKANEVERTRALAELRTADYQIQAEVGKAEADVASAKERETLAEERYRAFAERLDLVERSVRVGEGALVELVRARANLFEADVARLQSQIAVMQARSRLNQALGLDPWSWAPTKEAER